MNPLSEQEVADFIHKLSTESKKVSLLFFNKPMGVTFALPGRLEVTADGVLNVWPKEASNAPRLLEVCCFTTSVAGLARVPCHFFDPRLLKDLPAIIGLEVPISFGLVFIFPNASFLIINQIDDDNT